MLGNQDPCGCLLWPFAAGETMPGSEQLLHKSVLCLCPPTAKNEGQTSCTCVFLPLLNTSSHPCSSWKCTEPTSDMWGVGAVVSWPEQCWEHEPRKKKLNFFCSSADWTLYHRDRKLLPDMSLGMLFCAFFSTITHSICFVQSFKLCEPVCNCPGGYITLTQSCQTPSDFKVPFTHTFSVFLVCAGESSSRQRNGYWCEQLLLPRRACSAPRVNEQPHSSFPGKSHWRTPQGSSPLA